jgi:hypothetical protein
MNPTPTEQSTLIDPLTSRAWGLLAVPGGASDAGDVDEVAGRLLADELLVSSSFEVGTWGQSAFKRAAQTAARLRCVAVGGDEVPPASDSSPTSEDEPVAVARRSQR